jgi:hypothetical protein
MRRGERDLVGLLQQNSQYCKEPTLARVAELEEKTIGTYSTEVEEQEVDGNRLSCFTY